MGNLLSSLPKTIHASLALVIIFFLGLFYGNRLTNMIEVWVGNQPPYPLIIMWEVVAGNQPPYSSITTNIAIK